jgi:hypothetical protein
VAVVEEAFAIQRGNDSENLNNDTYGSLVVGVGFENAGCG